jgi:hypothetical protein
MSGILASGVIRKGTSCKIYSNSSGNAASITVHTKVPSVTNNACLSIKVSDTDAAINSCSVDSTTDVDIVDTVALIQDPDRSYNGFTCVDTSNGIIFQTFTDSAGTTTPAFFSSYTLNDTGLCCMYPSTRNRPVSFTCFGQSNLGCPYREWCMCECSCCPTLISTMMCQIPNFHTEGSGEKHTNLIVKCCNPACQKVTIYPAYELAGSSCCFMNFSDYENSLIESQTLYCCTATSPSLTRYIENEDVPVCSGMIVTDLWSDFGTTVYMEEWAGPASCQNYHIRMRDKTCDSSVCLLCTRSINMCGAAQVYQNDFRCIIKECCTSFTCCCCDEWQKTIARLPAAKPFMVGCDVTVFQRNGGEGLTFLMYPWACYGGGTYERCYYCTWSYPWVAFGRPDCESCSCESCCQVMPCVQDVGGGALKWVWYNPFVNCNYMMIMGPDSDRRGVFSFEPTYWEPYLKAGRKYVQGCISTFIDDGFIKKVSDLSSAMCCFVKCETEGGCYTIMSNPTLVGDCCWALWAQCFTWGDTSLDSVGWNECFQRYHSSNLADWEKSTTVVSNEFTSGSGNSLCTVTTSNIGTDFNRCTNFYFNSDNCVGNEAVLEHKVSANRLERTGVVVSNGSNVYVNNSGEDTSFTIWGYDE